MVPKYAQLKKETLAEKSLLLCPASGFFGNIQKLPMSHFENFSYIFTLPTETELHKTEPGWQPGATSLLIRPSHDQVVKRESKKEPLLGNPWMP